MFRGVGRGVGRAAGRDFTVLPAVVPAVVPSSLRSAMATMETLALMRKSSPTAIIPIPMHHRTPAGATTSR